MRRRRDRIVFGIWLAVGVSLLGYAAYWFFTPRAFGDRAGQIQSGMTKREAQDVMVYPPGRYHRPFQRYSSHPIHSVERRKPSHTFHRWEGSDVRVVVGYDEHGLVNEVDVTPAR